MPSGSTHLPDPVVGLVQGAFEVIHQRSLDVPGIVRVMQQRVAGEGQTVEDFTPHVKLELRHSFHYLPGGRRLARQADEQVDGGGQDDRSEKVGQESVLQRLGPYPVALQISVRNLVRHAQAGGHVGEI